MYLVLSTNFMTSSLFLFAQCTCEKYVFNFISIIKIYFKNSSYSNTATKLHMHIIYKPGNLLQIHRDTDFVNSNR